MTAATETVQCPKCLGRGVFRSYSHIAGGRCFACNGAGTIKARVGSGRNVERPVYGRSDDLVEAAAIGRRYALSGWARDAFEADIATINGCRFGTEYATAAEYRRAVVEGFAAA